MRFNAEVAREISERALVKDYKASVKRCLRVIKQSARKGKFKERVYGVRKDVKAELEKLGFTVIQHDSVLSGCEWLTVYEIIWGDVEEEQ